jgi:hypothetical protein
MCVLIHMMVFEISVVRKHAKTTRDAALRCCQVSKRSVCEHAPFFVLYNVTVYITIMNLAPNRDCRRPLLFVGYCLFSLFSDWRDTHLPWCGEGEETSHRIIQVSLFCEGAVHEAHVKLQRGALYIQCAQSPLPFDIRRLKTHVPSTRSWN